MFFKELLQMLAQWNWAQAGQYADSITVKTPEKHKRSKRQSSAGKIRLRPLPLAQIKATMEYIVVDTETTGLDPDIDGIVEIALLKVANGKIKDSICTLINPEIHISESASRVNHIYDKDVRNAPKYFEIAPKVIHFMGDCTVVGHNVDFDLSFLDGLFANYDLPRDYTWYSIDTLALARRTIYGSKNYKLTTLVKHLDLPEYAAHRARGDAMSARDLFEYCKRKL